MNKLKIGGGFIVRKCKAGPRMELQTRIRLNPATNLRDSLTLYGEVRTGEMVSCLLPVPNTPSGRDMSVILILASGVDSMTNFLSKGWKTSSLSLAMWTSSARGRGGLKGKFILKRQTWQRNARTAAKAVQ